MKTKKPAVKKLTIGLDLGDRRHHACVLDAAGEIVAREVIVNTPELLTAFCARPLFPRGADSLSRGGRVQ